MKLLSIILVLTASLSFTTNSHATSQGGIAGIFKGKSHPERISDEKAVKLATKAIKKNKLFGGSIIQYSETKIKQYGQNLRVTFVRYLPPGVRGSEKIYSVELDAYTGKFVRFLGY
jgi:predicted small secreted protein